MASWSVLECVASGTLDVEAALLWLSNKVEDESALPEQLRGITRHQFAVEFLHALRLQTDPLLVPPASVTPRNTSSAATIHHAASPAPASVERRRRRAPGPTHSAGPAHTAGKATPPPRPASATPRTSCLGDYMLTVKHTPAGHKRGNRNTSTDSIDSTHTNATNVNTSTPNKSTPSNVNTFTPNKVNTSTPNTSTPNNVANVTPDTSCSHLQHNEDTSVIQSVTPLSVKSLESRLFSNSDVGFHSPEVSKSGQTQLNTTSKISAETITQTPETNNKNKSNVRRVNITSIDSTKSSPSVFNFKAVTEIDPSDSNQFKYDQNKHSTPITKVLGSDKCKSTPKVNNELNSETATSVPVNNVNKDKSRGKSTPKIANDTVNTNKEMSSVSETPMTSVSTPVAHARTVYHEAPPWTAGSEGEGLQGAWSRQATPATPLPDTPTNHSAGLSQCSGTSSGSGVSRVGMRPRALAHAFQQPQDRPDAPAAQPSAPPTPPAAACDARALDACGRLYAAILDNNLVDIAPNEIAYLGSLVRCGAREVGAVGGERAVVRSAQEAAHLARVALQHTALAAVARPPPRPADTEQHTSHLSVAHYDAERDGMAAFDHPHSFSAHKRQRDAFNHLYRCWRERNGSESGATESVRARARAIVGAGRGEVNVQHLAALVVTHLVHDTHTTMHESKLSKLRRRLTAPTTAAALPHEEFYREVLLCSESALWQQHAAAALANALAAALDVDKRASTEELCRRVRVVSVLGRLMGALAAGGGAEGGGDRPPSHHVVDNAVAAKQYSQPCVDVRALVSGEAVRGRVAVGVAFLYHYLSQLDHCTMRLPYYTRALRGLRSLHARLPSVHVAHTRAYLTWIVCSTFALATFPPHLLPSADRTDDHLAADSDEWRLEVDVEGTVDGGGAVDASVLHECCPNARTILGGPAASASGTAVTRHVTPVTLPPDPAHAVKQKERQLQTRLEQQLLQTSGAAARRALDVCVERATARGVASVTRLASRAVHHARDVVRQTAAAGPHTQMLLVAVFRGALQEGVARCVEQCTGAVQQHAARAVSALLEQHGAVRALAVVAGRRAGRALAQWGRDTYTPEVVCPDMAREVASALSAPHPAPTNEHCVTSEGDGQHAAEGEACSAAEALITLKECVCRVLEGAADEEEVRRAEKACRARPRPLQPATARAWQLHMLQLTVDLCVALVCRRPEFITTSFLQSMESIWSILSPPCSESTKERQTFTHNCKSTTERRQQTPPTRDNVASTNENPSPVKCGIEPINQHQDVSREESMDPANEELAPTPPTSDDDDSNRVENVVIDTAFVHKHVTQTNTRGGVCTCVAEAGAAEEADVWRRVVCARNVALLATAPAHTHQQVWAAWGALVSHLQASGRLPSRSLAYACLTLAHGDHRPPVLAAVRGALRAARGLHANDTQLVDVLRECYTTTH